MFLATRTALALYLICCLIRGRNIDCYSSRPCHACYNAAQNVSIYFMWGEH